MKNNSRQSFAFNKDALFQDNEIYLKIFPSKDYEIELSKNYFEIFFWKHKKQPVGFDEVGRGCIFGPMLTSISQIPFYNKNSGLKDSKKLSVLQRTKVAIWINENCASMTTSIDPWLIDKININNATTFALKKGLHDFSVKYKSDSIILLSDFIKTNEKNLNVSFYFSAPKGESWSENIAAASIFAKTKRDALLDIFAKHMPIFMLDKNKGYGTQKHSEQVFLSGYSFLHRKTFCTSLIKNKIKIEG